MADFTTPASNAGFVRNDTLPIKPMVALGLVILADWLFYNEHIRYPGAAAGLLPTIGTLLLLESGLNNDRAPLRDSARVPLTTMGITTRSTPAPIAKASAANPLTAPRAGAMLPLAVLTAASGASISSAAFR